MALASYVRGGLIAVFAMFAVVGSAAAALQQDLPQSVIEPYQRYEAALAAGDDAAAAAAAEEAWRGRRARGRRS